MLSVEPSNKEVKVKSPSYYAIRCGYKTGVVQSWDECSKMTNGYPNAEFKSFTNAFDANNYILEALIDKPQEVVDVDTNAVGEDDFIQENLSEEQTSAYNKYLHREKYILLVDQVDQVKPSLFNVYINMQKYAISVSKFAH